MRFVGQLLEITFVLIILFLVLNNGSAFSSVVRSLGSVYTGSVKVLQGR